MQDGQRGAQRGVRRAHHGGGHAHFSRQQPHRSGPGQKPAGGGDAADEARATRLRRGFAPLAHPAGPLCVPGTQAALLGMPGGAVLRLSAQDAGTVTPQKRQGIAARAAGSGQMAHFCLHLSQWRTCYK